MSDFCFDFVLYLSAALAVCILSDCGSPSLCFSLFLSISLVGCIYILFLLKISQKRNQQQTQRDPPAKTSNGTHKKIYYKKILQTLLANQTHSHTHIYKHANTHATRQAGWKAGRPEKASSEILLHTCGRQLQFHMCCAAPARGECAHTHTLVYTYLHCAFSSLLLLTKKL